MAKFLNLIHFFIIAVGSAVFAEDNNNVNKREPRHLLQTKLCYKFGICGGGGYQGGHGFQGGNGYQGGYGGYNGGYGGYQGGYPYSPINIGISQSQSSASSGGGDYGSAAYPNNFQYNNGYPNNGYPNNGFPYNGGYNGHRRPGYYNNGYGPYTNQFNGNYYNGQGGYGFQRPFDYNDDDAQEDNKPTDEDYDGDNSRSNKD